MEYLFVGYFLSLVVLGFNHLESMRCGRKVSSDDRAHKTSNNGKKRNKRSHGNELQPRTNRSTHLSEAGAGRLLYTTSLTATPTEAM